MLRLDDYLSTVFSTFVPILNLINQPPLFLIFSAFLISFLLAVLQSSDFLS